MLWGICEHRAQTLHNVTDELFHRMTIAERWREELDKIPEDDPQLRSVWLASKLRMDAFHKVERVIYERTLKRDLDLARTWHAPPPPSASLTAFALGLCVLMFAVPMVWLLMFATELGQKRSWTFLLAFFFEFMLTYFLIAPLTILFNKIFLPSMLDERLHREADDEADAARRPGAHKKLRSYPYRTPLPETPLDFLVEQEPDLQAMVATARRRRGHGHHVHAHALKHGRAELGAVPRLEALEEIYEETHWSPTWTSWFTLQLLGYFLELPDEVQDVLMEETLLILPACTRGRRAEVFAARFETEHPRLRPRRRRDPVFDGVSTS